MKKGNKAYLVKIGAIWFVRWIGFVAVYVLFGAVVGAIVGWPVSLIFGMGFAPLDAVLNGASIGARYLGVWAGGLALVSCFMYGHYLNSRNQNTEDESTQ